MRIVFMGTPDFSVPALAALIDAGHEIAAVYCQPPRPAGRGKKERPSAVESYARKIGLTVRTPINFKSQDDITAFADLNADIAVVVAYGLILPDAILNAPKKGCLNIHASLLPRWRGAAPIHRAIMAGDTKTGVCIMQMDTGLDTGPVLLCEETKIATTDTTALLHDKLSDMGARLIVEALDNIDKLEPAQQPQEGVSYAAKISKEEAAIDWSKSAHEVDCHIRGLSPFPGAWFMHNGQRIKVLMSQKTNANGLIGEVLDDALTIGTKNGAVQLLKLQRAGKSVMDTETFLRGFDILKGQRLGL